MTIIVSVLTGIIGGVLAGFFGIGGATIMIPAMIYFLNLDQHTAQGTAIAALLPPVGILAAIKYFQGGNVVVNVALYISIGFLIGGLIGATIVHPVPDNILRKLFAVYLILIAVRMLF